jgi:hypothetical protein
MTLPSPSTNPKGAKDEEKTELLYGVENVVVWGYDSFMQNVQERMDLLVDKNGLSIVIGYDIYKDNYIDIIKRAAKLGSSQK